MNDRNKTVTVVYYGFIICCFVSIIHSTCFSVSISKLEEAFSLNPNNPDVCWLLGMALTMQALLTPDSHDVKLHFDSADVYFKRAFRQDPSNPSYQFSSELADFKYHEQTQGLCPRTKVISILSLYFTLLYFSYSCTNSYLFLRFVVLLGLLLHKR